MEIQTIDQIINDLESLERLWREGESQYNKGRYDGLWIALFKIKQIQKWNRLKK
jgi:hypothetical protein